MFEFTILGSTFLGIALGYALFFAPRVLPERLKDGPLTRKYRMGPYLTEVRVVSGSKLEGKSCREARINERYSTTVLEVLRGNRRYIENVGTMPLAHDDMLIVQGSVEDLLKLRKEQGLELLPEVKLSDEELTAAELLMAEGVVTPTSGMRGKTLKEIDFRHRFGGFVLAVRRLGGTARAKIAHLPLRFSDSLLMLIPRTRLDELRESEDLVIVSEFEYRLRRGRLWWLVFLLIPLAVTLAAVGVIEIAAAVLLSAIVLLAARALRPQEAYRSVDWSVLIMIAAMVPVGGAIVSTGTAEFMASRIVAIVGLFPPELVPYAVLALVYLVTSLFTELISNAAAVIILVPIALSVGDTLGVESRPLVMAVCFAASAAFMTPMGYQTNLMVYGPGGYRFLDFVRVGAPLNLIFWIVATLLIPRVWPF